MTFDTIVLTVASLFFSWVGFFGIIFIDNLKRKYKREMRQLKIDAWQRSDYKEAEEMLLKSNSYLVLREGDNELAIPNNLKKDFYVFVNKGLTSTQNYDNIYSIMRGDI